MDFKLISYSFDKHRAVTFFKLARSLRAAQQHKTSPATDVQHEPTKYADIVLYRHSILIEVLFESFNNAADADQPTSRHAEIISGGAQ
jgi:hypothetical protein